MTARERRCRDEIYCIELQANGCYAPVNRYYKGIGINPNEHNHVWIDYDALAGFALKAPLTVGKAKWIVGNAQSRPYEMGPNADIWACNAHYGGQRAPLFLPDDAAVMRVWLYSDRNNPDANAVCRREYDARIERLKSLVADPAEFAAALDPTANLHLLQASAA